MAMVTDHLERSEVSLRSFDKGVAASKQPNPERHCLQRQPNPQQPNPVCARGSSDAYALLSEHGVDLELAAERFDNLTHSRDVVVFTPLEAGDLRLRDSEHLCELLLRDAECFTKAAQAQLHRFFVNRLVDLSELLVGKLAAPNVFPPMYLAKRRPVSAIQACPQRSAPFRLPTTQRIAALSGLSESEVKGSLLYAQAGDALCDR